MAQGRFERRRRRRRKKTPVLPIVLLIALAVVLGLLLSRCGDNSGEDTQPQTSSTAGQTTAGQTTAAPQDTTPISVETTGEPAPQTTTVPVTQAETTAPTTAPATEPTTAPTTEPTTVPTTEPTTVPTTQPEPETSLGDAVAKTAMALVGCEYEYGGSGPDTFDTSGLVYYCHQENGIDLPRAFGRQAESGRKVSREDLLPGDVLFFWTTDPEKAQYVGVYVGDGKFVAARNSEKPVSLMDLNSAYFSERFLFARRCWEE